jgi:hypothetical protein
MIAVVPELLMRSINAARNGDAMLECIGKPCLEFPAELVVIVNQKDSHV